MQRVCNKLNRKLRAAVDKHRRSIAALNTARAQMVHKACCAQALMVHQNMILEEHDFVLKFKLKFDGYGVTSTSSSKRMRNTRRNIRRLYFENQKLGCSLIAATRILEAFEHTH